MKKNMIKTLLVILFSLITYFVFKTMLVFCNYGIDVVGLAAMSTALIMVSLLLITFGISLIIMGINLMTGGR
jgi:hypothetical protein